MSVDQSEGEMEGIHGEGGVVKEVLRNMRNYDSTFFQPMYWFLDEIIRKIILEMKKNSVLHDISNPRYQKDRNKAIESTAAKLKITPKLLRKKITYIKGQYTKQRDSLLNAKKLKGRSGDALPDDFETKKVAKIWKWFDECHFLDDVDVDDMVESTIFSNYGPVKVNTKGDVDLDAADLMPDLPESESRPPSPKKPNLVMQNQVRFEPIPGTSKNHRRSHSPSSPVHILSSSDDNNSEPFPKTSRDYSGLRPSPKFLQHSPSIHDQNYFEPTPGSSKDRPPSPKKATLSLRDQQHFEPVPGSSKDHSRSRPPSPKKAMPSMRNQAYFEPVLLSPHDQELPKPTLRSGILDTSPNVDTDIIFMILNVVHSFLQQYSRMDQLRMLVELTAFLKDFDNKINKNEE